MWKCTKCGEESNDQFDACWKCGTVDPNSAVAAQSEKLELTQEESEGASEAKARVPRVPPGLTSRYADAYLIARGLVSSGGIIKALGIVLSILIGLCSIGLATKTDSSFAVAGIVLALILGVVIYVFGLLLAALGQILKAALDTAVNTSPFLNNEARKKIMSLSS